MEIFAFEYKGRFFCSFVSFRTIVRFASPVKGFIVGEKEFFFVIAIIISLLQFYKFEANRETLEWNFIIRKSEFLSFKMILSKFL